jgi:hypothetical protein
MSIDFAGATDSDKPNIQVQLTERQYALLHSLIVEEVKTAEFIGAGSVDEWTELQKQFERLS